MLFALVISSWSVVYIRLYSFLLNAKIEPYLTKFLWCFKREKDQSKSRLIQPEELTGSPETYMLKQYESKWLFLLVFKYGITSSILECFTIEVSLTNDGGELLKEGKKIIWISFDNLIRLTTLQLSANMIYWITEFFWRIEIYKIPKSIYFRKKPVWFGWSIIYICNRFVCMH